MVRDASVRRLLAAHFLSSIGEWAVSVGLLVHAFDWGGSAAVGVLSVSILVPSFAGAPVVGAAMARWRTLAVRQVALAVQVGAYGAAAVAAALDAPSPAVAPFIVLGLACTTTVPPTSVALLPRIARSTDDLVDANLWLNHCDSASALVGSLVAAFVVGIGGPEAVFVQAAVGAAVAVGATTWRPAPLARSARTGSSSTGRVLRGTLAELRDRPWSRGVLAAASARNVLVGGFDVLLVILALDALQLGESGSGYLTALVGAGSLLSTFVTTAVVRRARLRGALMTAIVLAATLAVVLGLRIERPVVFVALPVIGVCMAVMDATSRTLLQRSTDPRRLGPLFATLGLIAGAGQVAGSIVVQVALAVGDVEVALVVLGAVLVGLAAASVTSLRRADANADVPAVEMALLASLPMFASLPTPGLERVARATERIAVDVGQAVVLEGDRSTACFVVADGEVEVSSRGGRTRTAARGDVIGEVALLASTPSLVSATAVRPGSVLRIERRPFLVALTGRDVDADALDFAVARQRYREIVDRAGRTDRADQWLSLGAVGRFLADPSYLEALAQGARLAIAENDEALLAEAAALSTWPGAFFHIAENPDHEMIAVCESALSVLRDDDPMRVRVLATLASNLTFASEPEQRSALIGEAHALAASHADPALEGAVLNAEFLCRWEPATLDRREQIAAELTSLGTRLGDPELAYLGGFFAAYCLAERSRLGDARAALIGLRYLAPETHNQYFEFLSERLLLSIDIALGEPDVRERVDALAVRHGSTHADTDGTWALQVGALANEAGTLGELVPMIATMLDGPHTRTWRAALALAQLRAGDRQAATATLAEQGDVPPNYFWLTVLQVQAEVAAELGLASRCSELFDHLAPYRGQLGITASGSLCYGLVSRSLGALAIALGRTDDAIDLLSEAMATADANGMPFEQVVTRRLLLEARRSKGRSDERLVEEGLAIATERGFERERHLLSGTEGS